MTRSSSEGPRVTLVAAVARNGVIGDGPRIPWRVPGEQAHFKAVTLGHTLVMGRTTYDSIGRPLPGRTTIVLTRDPSWTAGPTGAGVLVAHGRDEALALAGAAGSGVELFVAGGAAVYELFLADADRQLLSEIPLDPPGDVRYPAFDRAEWAESSRETHEGFDVVTWVRVAGGAGPGER